MPPWTPIREAGSIVSEGREVWVKVRASEAERAEWHAKARSVGLSLSNLVRRSVGRVRTWTVAHAELERERTRELARIGSNLNQIARWANTHKENAEALEVVTHLVAIERALDTLTVEGNRDDDQVSRSRNRVGSAAADYLTREQNLSPDQDQDRDPEKNPEEVKVLRGNPHQVAAVADGLEFEHKYTSGVIAWATGGQAERCANRPSGGRVRENRLGGPRTGPLRLGSGPAPRSGRGCPRACPGGALRS